MIRDVTSKLVGVLLLAGASSAIAGAPTAIANNTGYSAACYDFNDYIPSADSPVVGGAAVLRTKPYSGGRFLTHFFGKVCASQALVYAPDSWGRDGYLTYYGSYTSEWYISGPAQKEVACAVPSYYQPACYEDLPEPRLKVVCPFNTAPIKVSGYTRSDGGVTWTNVHGYDVGSNPAWYDPRSIPGVTSSMETVLCVKTDTTQ